MDLYCYYREMHYYVRHSQLDLEEGKNMEFKGHRMFSKSQVPVPPNGDVQLRQTRQHVSKYVCGMLNTGVGGTLLLGVLDNGTVEGFMMNQFQRDHFVLSVQNTLENKFRPAVPPHFYSITFVPVVESEEDAKSVGRHFEWNNSILQDENLVHVIGANKYCWCDANAIAAFNIGIMNPFFVIQLKIYPWDGGRDPRHRHYPNILNVSDALMSFLFTMEQAYFTFSFFTVLTF